MRNIRSSLLFALFYICELPVFAGRLVFDFAQSDHGFSAGFADYPPNADYGLYQTTNAWTDRPSGLGEGKSLFISGINRSDDLFMFWKKKISGLPPDTQIFFTAEIELASKYAVGLVGVGGAPGEGVILKAGATAYEPMVITNRTDNLLIMNLDKGNQSVGGSNMVVIGHIGKPEDGNESYVMLTRHQHGNPFSVTTAGDGSFWFIFGTDSGFEAQTALFYTKCSLWINRPDAPRLWLEPGADSSSARLIWNEIGRAHV